MFPLFVNITSLRGAYVGLSGLLPLVIIAGGCSAFESGADSQRNNLDQMDIALLQIGETTFEVWLATTAEQRAQGLMGVEAVQMEPREDGVERGMLFSFPSESVLSFWMKDTLIPLDIAFANQQGVIVHITSMQPLTLQSHSSISPAQFALEVNEGVFEKYGVKVGDQLVLSEVPGAP